MGLFGKKKDKDNNKGLIPVPERAYGGDYFRTSSFTHPQNPDFVTWQEARKNPLNGLWTIKEITKRPNTVRPGDGDDTIEEVKTKQENLIFFDAVRGLSIFEISEEKMGLKKTAPEDPEAYFRTFSKNEGTVIFDKYNMPHPTRNGEVMTDGIFTPEARREAKERYEAAKAKHSSLDPDLVRKYSEVAFNDIDDLLDQGLLHVKWREFVDALEVLMDKFENVQKKNFSNEEFVRSGWVHTPAVSMYEKALEMAKEKGDALKNAKGQSTKKPLLDNTQRDLIDRFFTEIEMAYEIAQAKYHYIGLAEARMVEGDAKEKANRIRKHTRQAEKKIDSLGEDSGWSPQRLNTEIVSGRFSEIAYEGAEGFDEDEYIVYYAPRSLYRFVDSCKQLIGRYDEGMSALPEGKEETKKEETPKQLEDLEAREEAPSEEIETTGTGTPDTTHTEEDVTDKGPDTTDGGKDDKDTPPPPFPSGSFYTPLGPR